jgi:NADH-quinone oxidoreductase subunit C
MHPQPQGWTSLMSWFAPGQLTVTLLHDEVTLHVNLSSFLSLVRILRDQSRYQFKTLVDMTAVDYPARDPAPRFDVVYHRLSVRYQTRCRVQLQVDERTRVPSLTSLYASAGWSERECFDMFGIGFEGHPDLRRLLTDYGFEGHPRRKDFPLTGFTEVRYDEVAKRVVCEPLQRSQDYRAFDFRTAWKPLPDSLRVRGDLSSGNNLPPASK